jgi:hypothetical protein
MTWPTFREPSSTGCWPAPRTPRNTAPGLISCWHRGHFIAYSPRAGRGSGLATIAWDYSTVNNPLKEPAEGLKGYRMCPPEVPAVAHLRRFSLTRGNALYEDRPGIR